MYAAAQKQPITNANTPTFHDTRLRDKIDTEVCDGKRSYTTEFKREAARMFVNAQNSCADGHRLSNRQENRPTTSVPARLGAPN